MKSTSKCKLVTALLCALLVLLFLNVIALWPQTKDYILLAFAIPGGIKFSRTLYIWLQLEDTPIDWPWKKRKPMSYKEWAEAHK